MTRDPIWENGTKTQESGTTRNERVVASATRARTKGFVRRSHPSHPIPACMGGIGCRCHRLWCAFSHLPRTPGRGGQKKEKEPHKMLAKRPRRPAVRGFGRDPRERLMRRRRSRDNCCPLFRRQAASAFFAKASSAASERLIRGSRTSSRPGHGFTGGRCSLRAQSHTRPAASVSRRSRLKASRAPRLASCNPAEGRPEEHRRCGLIVQARAMRYLSGDTAS